MLSDKNNNTNPQISFSLIFSVEMFLFPNTTTTTTHIRLTRGDKIHKHSDADSGEKPQLTTSHLAHVISIIPL